MSVITLAADSTSLILNGAGITQFAEGDFITLTPVNPKTGRVNSATGVNINNRMDGDVYDLVVRVQKYGSDDVLLQSWVNSSTPVVINGSAKEQFQRDGRDFTESYTLDAGSFTKQPTDTKNNQEGNEMMEYTIQFRRAKRNL
jgi:hypothetical protein